MSCLGNYQIELLHNDMVTEGSPFIAKAYDPGAIVVGQISSGVVGNPVEFTSKCPNDFNLVIRFRLYYYAAQAGDDHARRPDAR